MRKPLFLALGVVLLSGSGAVAYWKLKPAPPAQPSAAERGYKDIDRKEMEGWLQDLGYSE